MFSLYTLDILYNVTFFITLIYGWQIYSGSADVYKRQMMTFVLIVGFVIMYVL